MNTIQVRVQHVLSEEAYTDVNAVISDSVDREIHESTAVTIASWWQAPAGTGYVLAGFASGATVDRTALLDDIYYTNRQEGRDDGTMTEQDANALDCLATFVINYTAEETP
jgi:hypothetical protein